MTTGQIFIISYTKLPRVGGWVTFHVSVHLTPILRSWTPFIDFHLIGQVLAGGTYFSFKGNRHLRVLSMVGKADSFLQLNTRFSPIDRQIIIFCRKRLAIFTSQVLSQFNSLEYATIFVIIIFIIIIVKSKNQGSAL